jgi:hypothetical protein
MAEALGKMSVFCSCMGHSIAPFVGPVPMVEALREMPVSCRFMGKSPAVIGTDFPKDNVAKTVLTLGKLMNKKRMNNNIMEFHNHSIMEFPNKECVEIRFHTKCPFGSI